MRRPKSPREDTNFTLRLPNDVIEALDSRAKQHKMYRSELIESYLRYALENENEPRFPLYEFVLLDWVVIYDRLARRLVVVGIQHEKNKPVWCYYDESDNCVHAEFVKRIPIFHDLAKKKSSS